MVKSIYSGTSMKILDKAPKLASIEPDCLIVHVWISDLTVLNFRTVRKKLLRESKKNPLIL